MRKICVFTSTRAEYGLLKPLLQQLKNDEIVQLQLFVSGGHLATSQGYTINEIVEDGFSIDARAEILMDSITSTAICTSMGLAMQSFSHNLHRLRPDILVILGDRYETLCIASVAMIFNIPIAHIHGGEITIGLIDDSIRHAVTKMAHLHFSSCAMHSQRIIQLGESPERVWNVGALGVENTLSMPLLSEMDILTFLDIPIKSPYFLCTFHPVTLESGQEEMHIQALIAALDFFPDYKVIFTGSNADLGGNNINHILQNYAASQPERVKFYHSLGVLRYLSAAKYAAGVVGNSSSGIIEIPSLGVPVLNIGERQKGRISAKSVLHCMPNTTDIKHNLELIIKSKNCASAIHTQNPYEKNGTSATIATILRDYPLEGIIKKVFYDTPR